MTLQNQNFQTTVAINRCEMAQLLAAIVPMTACMFKIA